MNEKQDAKKNLCQTLKTFQQPLNLRKFPSFLMIYLKLQMPRGGSGSSPDSMLQILQMLVSDRQAERAERQANLATLQHIAQMANNNQAQEETTTTPVTLAISTVHHPSSTKTMPPPIPTLPQGHEA